MNERYLEAKRSIDDRSLNTHVWNTLVETVAQMEARPLRIAEIGAGTGTMIDRLHEWGVLERWGAGHRPVHYHGWELNPETGNRLARRLEQAVAAGMLSDGQAHIDSILAADRLKVDEPFDVLIAHAVIDLFSPAEFQAVTSALVRPGGIVAATITFDGHTHFEPAIDPPLDRAIIDAYHGSMRQQFASLHLTRAIEAGMKILSVGSSDWVVCPTTPVYGDDDRALVGTILDMVTESVIPVLGDDRVAPWIRMRREQLAAGQLIFTAHQLDMLVVA